MADEDETSESTPESIDVEESLQDALDQSHKSEELPNQDLFRLDGFGQKPETPNRTGYFGIDDGTNDDA